MGRGTTHAPDHTSFRLMRPVWDLQPPVCRCMPPYHHRPQLLLQLTRQLVFRGHQLTGDSSNTSQSQQGQHVLDISLDCFEALLPSQKLQQTGWLYSIGAARFCVCLNEEVESTILPRASKNAAKHSHRPAAVNRKSFRKSAARSLLTPSWRKRLLPNWRMAT